MTALSTVFHFPLEFELTGSYCITKIMRGIVELADQLYLSLSPSHLDTRSDEETDIKVELFASVATAFARYDLPVPGGYKHKRFLHNLLTMISLALINRTEYTRSLKQKDTQNPNASCNTSGSSKILLASTRLQNSPYF